MEQKNRGDISREDHSGVVEISHQRVEVLEKAEGFVIEKVMESVEILQKEDVLHSEIVQILAIESSLEEILANAVTSENVEVLEKTGVSVIEKIMGNAETLQREDVLHSETVETLSEMIEEKEGTTDIPHLTEEEVFQVTENDYLSKDKNSDLMNHQRQESIKC